MYNNHDPVIYPRSQPNHSSELSTAPTPVNSFSSPKINSSQANTSEKHFSDYHFWDNAPIGMFRLSATGQYLKVNQCFAQWHGYNNPAAFLIDEVECRDRFAVDPQQEQIFFDKLKKQKIVNNFEIARKRRDNQIVWLSCSAQSFETAENEYYYEGYAWDITAYKTAVQSYEARELQYQSQNQQLEQIQTQLIQSEKLVSLGQLLAGIAHEINNPVSFIYSNITPAEEYAQDLIGFIKCYEENCTDLLPAVAAEAEAIDLDFLLEDFPKLIASMKIGAERLNQIVQSLRNFSHFNDRQQQPINIHKAIDSTLQLLQHRLKAQGDYPEIKVIKHYGQLPPAILAYGGLLNQVFMNLLANGIDAIEDSLHREGSNQHPTLRIHTEATEDCVIIRIGDNGIGIPAALRDRIFDAFFTTKPTGKGTGLGLSISHQIITEKHNGQLSCYSTPESGTEFVIQLPLSSHSQGTL